MPGPDGLIGRAAELAVFDRALAGAQAGRGALLLVTGPAGIGKTALLEATTSAAAARGLVTARGYASDDPGAPALWPWLRLTRGWPGADDLPAPEQGEPDAASRFRLFVAFTELLRGRAGSAGLLVGLEDLHWADALSVQLLRHLVAELAELPLVVVATARDRVPGPFDDALPTLLGAHVATPLVLGPLSIDDVGTWLPALVDRPSAGLAAAVHGRTGGIPLFVRLVAEDAARAGGAVGDNPQLWRVVAARLRTLPAEAHEVVEAAAVVGERMPVAVLAAMLEGPATDVRTIAVPALVPDGSDAVRFEHALMRDAVYAAVAPGVRTGLHRRAAQVLAELAPVQAAGSIAHHWRQAGGTDGATRCATWACRADDQARAVLAFDDDAAAFAELAVTAAREAGVEAGFDDGEIARLLIRHAQALYLANYLAASLERCVEAADLAEAAGRPELVAEAALVVQGMGDPAANRTVPQLCERALATLPTDAYVTRARLLAQIAVGVAEGAGGPRAAELAAEALAEAERSGDDEAILEAIAARHLAINMPQTVQERLELGRRAIDLGRSMSRPIAALWGHLWRVDAALQLGNLLEVEHEMAEIERVAESRGSPLARWHHLRCRARELAMQGEFAAADAANEAARDVGRRIGDVSIEGMYYSFRVQMSWVRGVVDVGPGWTELMAHAPPMPLIRVSIPLMHAVGGDLEVARAEFEEFRHVPRSYPVGTRWLGTVALIGVTAVLLDDPQVCADVYDLLAPVAHYHSGDGSGAPFGYGSNSGLVADLARVSGRPDVACGHYADAIAMNARVGARPFTALARLGQAQALLERRGPGDLTLAAETVGLAAAEFRRLDMPGRLATATALIKTIETVRRTSSPLSVREAEVAALVADALTNREIAERLHLSERTVESHVRSILAKLGLRTRTEIVAWSLRGAPTG